MSQTASSPLRGFDFLGFTLAAVICNGKLLDQPGTAPCAALPNGFTTEMRVCEGQRSAVDPQASNRLSGAGLPTTGRGAKKNRRPTWTPTCGSSPSLEKRATRIIRLAGSCPHFGAFIGPGTTGGCSRPRRGATFAKCSPGRRFVRLPSGQARLPQTTRPGQLLGRTAAAALKLRWTEPGSPDPGAAWTLPRSCRGFWLPRRPRPQLPQEWSRCSRSPAPRSDAGDHVYACLGTQTRPPPLRLIHCPCAAAALNGRAQDSASVCPPVSLGLACARCPRRRAVRF